ncbi:coiled-coil domain-containing protein 179 isoform X5 [Canis lupus dingo]|uniref:coiled-coil domain-containing protein 179 isoform X5 n=1 Tax=Canis lupus dingo TaxID=286419 RepID=UPI000BAA2B36|nr:coiled-coil domain-containing protein 179 isoform X5 [Canis lupus dingo]|eukprot:XP_022263141.1 coiled-coil domain-containing protein 179 isoform X4 [Canis lupus familiaris]
MGPGGARARPGGGQGEPWSLQGLSSLGLSSMCLCCTEDDAIQVNPVSAQGPPSPWGPVIPTIRKGQDGSILRKSLQGSPEINALRI